ncbi:hypothetical protein [Sulfurisphaera ohwakuensis]|uniref:Uncharacterized protein n=1 Tax=Sulfurisphaera ohwakuensis TaxID=69656 RepID=A0A7J9RVQ4_SULOH|nr:hypothetical protein [Sulfurisphaera ohwakuensis]MBB5255087.1 hypothetical protein [Sulfurisphaera ohwakuensis]
MLEKKLGRKVSYYDAINYLIENKRNENHADGIFGIARIRDLSMS